MISNMDYKYDYYHNSSSNEETETDFSYEIPQTYKKKKVSSYKSVSKIIDKEYLLNITPPPKQMKKRKYEINIRHFMTKEMKISLRDIALKHVYYYPNF